MSYRSRQNPTSNKITKEDYVNARASRKASRDFFKEWVDQVKNDPAVQKQAIDGFDIQNDIDEALEWALKEETYINIPDAVAARFRHRQDLLEHPKSTHEENLAPIEDLILKRLAASLVDFFNDHPLFQKNITHAILHTLVNPRNSHSDLPKFCLSIEPLLFEAIEKIKVDPVTDQASKEFERNLDLLMLAQSENAGWEITTSDGPDETAKPSHHLTLPLHLCVPKAHKDFIAVARRYFAAMIADEIGHHFDHARLSWKKMDIKMIHKKIENDLETLCATKKIQSILKRSIEDRDIRHQWENCWKHIGENNAWVKKFNQFRPPATGYFTSSTTSTSTTYVTFTTATFPSSPPKTVNPMEKVKDGAKKMVQNLFKPKR